MLKGCRSQNCKSLSQEALQGVFHQNKCTDQWRGKAETRVTEISSGDKENSHRASSEHFPVRSADQPSRAGRPDGCMLGASGRGLGEKVKAEQYLLLSKNEAAGGFGFELVTNR